MKLLFDQNISFKLVGAVADIFPGSAHVRDFGLEQADDATVWAFARDNSFVITSKDDDFHQRSFRFGHPPKIVWLRIGNCPTAQIASLLRAHVADIVDFNNDPAASFLALR